MSTVISPYDQLSGSRRHRRSERRRLKRHDALSARLAELHAVRSLLEQAARIVGRGWVQGAWFTVATASGERSVTAYDPGAAGLGPVTGACLVGAVVEAAGGPACVRSQLVHRTLDLAWHALREDPERPVHWRPAPRLRIMRLLDLTHWNDAPERTQGEVVELLRAAQQTADAQRDRCRAEQAGLVATTPTHR